MDTTVLEIPIGSEFAQIYTNASEAERRKLAVMIQIWLSEMTHPGADTLGEIMNRISTTAQSRGLTPDILNQILADGDDE